MDKHKDMVEGQIKATANGGIKLPAYPPSNFASNITLSYTESIGTWL